MSKQAPKRRSRLEDAQLAANLGEYIGPSKTETQKFTASTKEAVIIVENKKKAPQKETKKKSRWENEITIPQDLNNLYGRIRDIIDIRIKAQQEIRDEELNQQRYRENFLELMRAQENFVSPGIQAGPNGPTQENSDAMNQEDGGSSLLDSLNKGRSGINYQKPELGRSQLELEQEWQQIGWFPNFTDLPVTLKEFVIRCYKRSVGRGESDSMREKLESIILTAKYTGEISNTDWDSYPMPIIFSDKFSKDSGEDTFLKIERVSGKFGQTSTSQGSLSSKGKFEQDDGLEMIPNRYQNMWANKAAIANYNKEKRMESALGELMHQKQVKVFDNVTNEQSMKFIDTKDYLADIRNSINFSDGNAEEIWFEKLQIQGTSQELDKPYFRLTEIPDPCSVRPEDVLRKSLAYVEKKLCLLEEDYRWGLDQLKSIRQDMKIQRIMNCLTVEVYEKNAMLCLEGGDLVQYNQCQAQQIELYREGQKGNKHEFFMLRVVYLALNGEKFEANRFLKEMSMAEMCNRMVQRAIDFKSSLIQGNIKKVFDVYRTSGENLKSLKKLISLFQPKLRIWALVIISKSFGQKLKTEFIQEFLEFKDLQECVEFQTQNACLDEDGNYQLLKQSRQKLATNILIQNKFD